MVECFNTNNKLIEDSTFMKLTTTLLVFLVILINCTSPDTVTYKGKIIQFDFNDVEFIDADSWVKFDDYKFEHVAFIEEGKTMEFPLPTHYMIIDTTNPDRDFGAPLDVKNVGLHIGRNLKKVNRIANNPTSQFTITEPQSLAAIGILKIMKTDSSTFTVTVPKDYTIDIKVLKK